jgi:hypothetical protein
MRDIWVPASLGAILVAILGVHYLSNLKPAAEVIGYVSSPETPRQEYLQFEGKPLTSRPLVQQFQSASAFTTKGDFKAAAVRRKASRKIARYR